MQRSGYNAKSDLSFSTLIKGGLSAPPDYLDAYLWATWHRGALQPLQPPHTPKASQFNTNAS